MKIDIYDSYAGCAGHVLHFDVIVESGTSPVAALEFGRRWLESIGEDALALEQTNCRFCHSRVADPEVERTVKNQGFFVFQMEGCPAPY